METSKPLIDIRRVTVEFLRPGPSHNQLLSPYTQYLAVCNDAGAALVTVPYEHRVFERRLKELRYETGDQSDRLQLLQEVGRDMGRLLESVPGLTGAVMNDSMKPGRLVHLRITLSAAELALLPFELAEVPLGSGLAIAIQARPTVSITRHIRTVSSEGIIWPETPRILFVSGDPDNVPFEANHKALVSAISPFRYPTRDDPAEPDGAPVQRFGKLLTVMVNPTLVELQRECEAQAYTHIHVLTHGDLDDISNESYGLVLRHENGSSDVVSGERFVSAITRVDHRPAVVMIASCDSGNVGSVLIPGASFVHAIHQAGIPFVLGAQFPLSKDGSVPLTSRLYTGLLWGDHPLHVLQKARVELHARFNTHWHDWASVVAYEAMPADLDIQLDALRYSQARRATNAALERIDEYVAGTVAAHESPDSLADAVHSAVARMPLEGQYAVECVGLRASARKRLSQAAFKFATRDAGAEKSSDPLGDPYDLLDQARLDYAAATRALLMNDARALQRKATLHWVLVQLAALSAVLDQELRAGEWEAARLAATHYLSHVDLEERAWAHASLGELWMLRLADRQLSAANLADCREQARIHTHALNALYPGVDEFPVMSTRRQFKRYVDWWGTDAFQDELNARTADCHRTWTADGELIACAKECAAILERRAPRHVKSPKNAPPQSGPDYGGNGNALDQGMTQPTDPLPPEADEAPQALGADGARSGKRRDKPFFRVEALPAGHGDCLWIEYGDRSKTYRWLIDCGTQPSAKSLLARVNRLPENERFLELFVMSHIDSDHIGGALPLFRAVKRGLRFGDVWFNGWRHVSGQLGARQGEMFSTAIQDFELPWNVWYNGAAVMVQDGNVLPQYVLPGGMTLTLLSPTRMQLDKLKPVWTRELKRYGLEPGTRVDYSRMLKGTPSTKADAAALRDIDTLADTPFGGDNGAPNGTSIAVLAEYEGASALLAADAHAPVLVASIRKLLAKRPHSKAKLKIDLFKVSHHGSQNNVSAELVQLLDCPRYLLSTNGDHFYHPDRQAMARIIKYGGDEKRIYFNYKSHLNDVWGDEALQAVHKQYRYSTEYPPATQPGIVVPLL